MSEMHQYTVKGHPKEKIIFIISFIAIFSAPYISEILYILNNKINFKLSIGISASTVFGVLYFVFSKVIWRTRLFAYFFKYPNLNGEYKVEAISQSNPTGNKIEWEGIMNIQQSWDKLIITLKTDNSTSYSKSIVGNIRYIPNLHYQLCYNYENTPECTQDELDKHEGFCSVYFEENLGLGEGYYFNNIKERQSYGTMKLKRRMISDKLQLCK